jgi:hypothetical protein
MCPLAAARGVSFGRKKSFAFVAAILGISSLTAAKQATTTTGGNANPKLTIAAFQLLSFLDSFTKIFARHC